MSEHDRLRGAGEYAHWQIDNFMAPVTWHTVGGTGEPAFENSWVNYGSVYGPAYFSKDAFGRVHIGGVVKSGTIAQTMFTLPDGFRPAYQEGRMVLTQTGSTPTMGNLQITAAGVVRLMSGGNTVVYLDAIFDAK